MFTSRKFKPLLLWLLLVPWSLIGQETTTIFTQGQLLWYVKNYHPISIQGELLLSKGESTVRKAKGGFDPYIYGNMDQKYYDEKEYYSILNGGLKIPTWYGIELKTGYDQNTGEFLNPENNVPSNGLWYAGISVPLGQGLFLDKRRATLKQAQIFSEATQAEQKQLMNNLYFDAVKQYWKWVEAWNHYLIYKESEELAQERFEGVKKSFEFGDNPAIDTLEAFLQVQNRQMYLNQSILYYQNATLELSNYLWFSNNTPLEISDSLRPPALKDLQIQAVIPSAALQARVEQLGVSHPAMQLYDFKLSSMDIDRKLKAEGLKPKINLNYNAINEPVGLDLGNNYNIQNYKWGFEVGFPLFLREQRGDLQLTKIKIQETELGQQQKLLELQNKLRKYFNEQVNLDTQITLFISAVGNYELLLKGEKQKFNTGESSLFLINSREMNVIQARLKLTELITKYNISQIGFEWAAGSLFTNTL